MPDGDARHVVQLCEKCRKPMAFAAAIPKLPEPGRLQVYRCDECEKLKFVDA